MKIFIAAGHGGSDPGAVAFGAIERDEAIKVVDGAALFLSQIIKPPNELIIVPHKLGIFSVVEYINSRTTDAAKDICLELHFNSNSGAPGTGTETYFGFKRLAEAVQRGIVGVLGLKDRGVKDGNYLCFNKSTKPGSALVEIGFINNPIDLLRVRQAGSLALARGIAGFLNLQLPATPPTPPPTVDWEKAYKELAEKYVKLTIDIKKLYEQIPTFTL